MGVVKVSADKTFSIPSMTYTGPTVTIPRWTPITDDSQKITIYTTADATYPSGIKIVNTTIDALTLPVNLGNGKVGIDVTAHGMPVGQNVTIQGTASYDGTFIIDASTTVNQIVIAFPEFVLETFNGSEKIFTGHVYVPVSEGIPKTFTYIAQGIINEAFTVFSSIADEFQVQEFIVDNSGNILFPVTITKDIFLINSTTNYNCSIESLPSFQGFTSTFGDGITSKKLSLGDNVLVKYAETLGASGGVFNTGVITKFATLLLDTTSNPALVYVTNDSLITGGQDYESVTSIKHKARALFGAGYRAHAKDDWLAILENNPLVAKAQVWTNFDLGQTSIGLTNSIVNISAVSANGTALTPTQQNSILFDTIKPARSITDITSFQELQSINARFVISARLDGVPSGPVMDAVFNALQAKYGILNTQYKVSIYDSDAIRVISDASTDIIFHQTSIEHVERSESYPEINDSVGARTIVVSFVSSQDANPINQVYLLPGSVELWIVRKIAGVVQPTKRIGKTDTIINTIIDGDNGYTIAGGIINYTMNQISYNIIDIINNVPPEGDPTFGVLNPTDTDPTGYWLRLVYKTQDGNGNFTNDIRLPYFFNITDIAFEDVNQFFSPSY